MRRVALLTLCFALWGAAPARAQAPSLAGETTLEGPSAGLIEVTLPKPVNALEGISAEVSGGGGVIGAVLLEAGPDPGRQRHELDAIRIGPEGTGGVMLGKGGEGRELPAGPYHLYLLADKPGSVRLRFADLDGAVTFTPDRPMEFDAGPLEPRLGMLPTITKWGRSGHVGPAGGLGVFWSLPRQPDPAGRLESCWYPYDADTAPSDYEPTCPGGMSTYETTPDAGTWSIAFFSTEDTDHGFGGNLTQMSAPLLVDAFGMWASWDRSLSRRAAAPPAPAPESSAPPNTEPPPPSSAPPPAPPTSPAVVATGRAKVRRGVAGIRVRCPGPAACRGRMSLGGRGADFLLQPGREAKLRVRLSRRVARLASRRRGVVRTVVVRTITSDRRMQTQRRVRLIRAR